MLQTESKLGEEPSTKANLPPVKFKKHRPRSISDTVYTQSTSPKHRHSSKQRTEEQGAAAYLQTHKIEKLFQVIIPFIRINVTLLSIDLIILYYIQHTRKS
jgi:hypothetical protein